MEDVIALGILAFSGVAMLGLLPVAFNSLQPSTFDTVALFSPKENRIKTIYRPQAARGRMAS